MEQHITRDRFSDFGQYRERLRCWDTEATQLSRGPLAIEFDCFDSGDLVVSRLRFDRDATLRSARNAAWCALIVDISPKRWCGIDLVPGTFLTIASRRETHVVSREPWDSISVVVKRETLAGWEAPLAELADQDPVPEDSIFATHPGRMRDYRAWIGALFSAGMPTCGPEDEALWRTAFREELRRHLLGMLGHSANPKPISLAQRVARYDLAIAGLRMVKQETEQRLTVTDLAQGLGVTSRSMQYAFRTVIGMSPAQYMLAERLNRARYHLMSRVPSGGSVTTVAFDHQFENLSRFAQQYTRLFGERPSDTLRSARMAFRQA